jgi:hypothetical protein
MKLSTLSIFILSIILMVLIFLTNQNSKRETYLHSKQKIRVVIPEYGSYGYPTWRYWYRLKHPRKFIV